MMKSIRTRLLSSFILVIILTVLVFEVFLIIGVRQYYIGNIKEILERQAEAAGKYCEAYTISQREIQKVRYELGTPSAGANGFIQDSSFDIALIKEMLTPISNAELQLYGPDGSRLDNGGLAGNGLANEKSSTPDIDSAKSGNTAVWEGKMKSTGEWVIAAAYPVVIDSKTEIIIRYVSSLSEAFSVIRYFTIICLVFGLLVVSAAALVGIALSKSIVNPLLELTNSAKEMAGGRMDIRADIRSEDEVGVLSKTINMLLEEINKNERIKDEFIASISHELRTPLTSIKGWTITLQTETDYNRALMDEGFDIIKEESDRLTKLVDELLDFSKISSNNLKLQKSSVNIAALTRYVEKQMLPRAGRKRISLVLEIEDDIPDIIADENRLKQVLINIVDNSLKFTSEGGHIVICLAKLYGHIKISVKDNGCGIPDEHLKRVIEKFYKVNDNAPGSGLGLAICSEIIFLHNGSMDVESTEGIGTSINILLPL